jgi:phage-related protein
MAKPLDWRGSALDDLRGFPDDAKSSAGYQLRKLQEGQEPDKFKPMGIVGPGTYEIIIDTANGWFRVMYVAKFSEAIYVLHSFQKKTNQTSKQDIDTAKRRYAAVVKERKSEGK